ncbi:hypothetical protein U14_03712 [Candidatus Moduliflexus flocculans]|uniref:Uncharacterized protein n=1 Tax=Candidatus Moduliflexus flocculans TaxID=1499966 RepID=A0A081BPZ5_9BACT|nr:hypothetical protein U14_03712 [Candidatus Moduliflexus flocculans]
MRKQSSLSIQPDHTSVADFCRLVEQYSQQTASPHTLADLCEAQAEALRITKQDASVDTVDLLLNTMLNSLWNLAEAQQQRRWTVRVKTAVARLLTSPKARPMTAAQRIAQAA